MKSLATAVKKALKPKQWYWSRHDKGFCAKAKWKVVAAKLGMPAFQVIAFVNRLDELANDGAIRGHLDRFDAAEVGVDLGMPVEDAARIYAALEEGEQPWIVEDCIASFYDRNPDEEDPTANLRDRRRRVRAAVRKQLADLKQRGHISAGERDVIEAGLNKLPDAELFDLPMQLARKELVIGQVLSTGDRGPRRESVSHTVEQRTQVLNPSVDNSGDKASGESAGPSDDGASGAAELWLATEGTLILTEQLLENRTKAEYLIGRWRDQELGGDAAALVEIIRGAEKTGLYGATFLNLIVVGIRDAKRRAIAQGELRLPVLASERKMG
jgi:hypothetical protein